jgi:hypothetical protein
MRKEFVTRFWQHAYEKLPAAARNQYLAQLKAAESWELLIGDAIELASRAKSAMRKLFHAPSRAH